MPASAIAQYDDYKREYSHHLRIGVDDIIYGKQMLTIANKIDLLNETASKMHNLAQRRQLDSNSMHTQNWNRRSNSSYRIKIEKIVSMSSFSDQIRQFDIRIMHLN